MYKKRPAILFFLAILFSPITQALTIDETTQPLMDFSNTISTRSILGSADIGSNTITGSIGGEDKDFFSVDLGSFELDDDISFEVTNFLSDVGNTTPSLFLIRGDRYTLTSTFLGNGTIVETATLNNPDAAENELIFLVIPRSSSSLETPTFDYKLSFDAIGDTAPVPLPPAVWLLGSAMVFLLRKRKLK